MTLETKAHAYWVDLGQRPYDEVQEIQMRVAEARLTGQIQDDILLVVEYNSPVIEFGMDNKKNQFSPKLNDALWEAGICPEDFISISHHLLDGGIALREKRRAGGATVIAPGQLVVYPVVNFERIVGHPFGIGAYKSRLDEVMQQVISSYNISSYIANGMNLRLERERRDVWVSIHGKDYKIGSKGIHTHRGGIAEGGFLIYVHQKGMLDFWMVNPCGYDHDDVSVISMEAILGEAPHMADIKDRVQEAIQQLFSYSRLENISEKVLYDKLGLSGVSLLHQ